MKAGGCIRLAALAAIAVALLASAPAAAEEAETVQRVGAADPLTMMGGFFAAALSVSVSVIGASWAVSKVGAAAMGAVAEKPELMGRSLVYIGLAEGLAIYGLIIAILILGRLPS